MEGHAKRAIGNVRTARFNSRMIDAEQAAEIEDRLADLLGVRVDDLRDYISGNIRAGGARRTGYRFVRGTHSGTYERDPNGLDMLPAGYSIPE
jgi:hypothetical protein